METVSLGITFATVGSSFGCSIPELLTATLFLIVVLNAIKLASMTTRTELICQSANAAAGRVQLTPAFQAIMSISNGTFDLVRFVVLFFVTFQGQYCEIGARTIAASKSNILAITILLTFVQSIFLLANMLIWMRDMESLIPTEMKQE